MELVKNYIRTINIKDFKWAYTKGKWSTRNVPLGEGMVNFKEYFSMLDQYKYNGPICIHYEYPLGGAERGAKELSMAPDVVLSAMKKDLASLKEWLSR